LPLRIRRLAKAAAAISLASAPLVAVGVPAINVPVISLPAFAASISSPHAQPAMRGARPHTHPVTPMVPGSGSVIMHEVNGDAGFSALLLAALLVPITMYGLAMRRRDRHEALLAAERSSSNHWRSASSSSMLADPLLQYFAPQPARPAVPQSSARALSAPRFQPRPGLTGRSTMSAPLAARTAAAQDGLSPFPGDPDPAGRAGNGPGEHAPLLPARSRTSPASGGPGTRETGGPGVNPVVRRTPVAGTPPWEPAQRPTTELPWAVIPPATTAAKPVTGLDSPAIAPPPDSVWDSAPAPSGSGQRPRSAAPQSLFEPAQPDRNLAGLAPGMPQVAPARAPMPASAPVPQDTGRQPTSWQDLPGSAPQKPLAKRRRNPDRGDDGQRGPIFVWSPTNPHDKQQ
jgi:hypothetical protein